MPTSCIVIDCYNHHQTGDGISFYHFPADNLERRRKWISFVSRQNEDGLPWEPANGNRVCSAHFIAGKKSDDPDFVPSVYPKTASKKARSVDAAELTRGPPQFGITSKTSGITGINQEIMEL